MCRSSNILVTERDEVRRPFSLTTLFTLRSALLTWAIESAMEDNLTGHVTGRPEDLDCRWKARA
jgi:hypothetical protein